MNQNAIERITSRFRQIPKVEAVLCRIGRKFQEEEYSLDLLEKKFETFLKAGISEREALRLLTKAAVELTTQEAPKWEMIAARLRFLDFENEMEETLKEYGIHSFYEKVVFLTKEKPILFTV